MDALAFPLRYSRRRRVHNADEIISRIDNVADRRRPPGRIPLGRRGICSGWQEAGRSSQRRVPWNMTPSQQRRFTSGLDDETAMLMVAKEGVVC